MRARLRDLSGRAQATPRYPQWEGGVRSDRGAPLPHPAFRVPTSLRQLRGPSDFPYTLLSLRVG